MNTFLLKTVVLISCLFFLFTQVKSQQVFAHTPQITQTVSFAENKVAIIVFVRKGCTHCEAEEAFLEELVNNRSDLTLIYYRLENEDERKIWDEFTSRLSLSKVTPITVIGTNYIIGFDKKETTGNDLLEKINEAKNKNIQTDLSKIDPNDNSNNKTLSTCPEDGSIPCAVEESREPFYITLPFLGKINTAKYPLVILSALLGFIDGFNPCAMWVLVTFLIILMQIGNRKKMFLFAGTFIIAEAIMYTLILTVWFKTWDFVRLDAIVTPIIGIVSILGGIFFLREWRKKELECKVTNIHQRAKIRARISKLAEDRFTIFTFLGILAIAFSVNIIEFACSIGIPQAFTKILDLNQLSIFSSAFFIFIYILFYMIDDFIVFGIALYGFDKLALTTKYTKWSNLIGGIVMILLGLILIFRPGILLF